MRLIGTIGTTLFPSEVVILGDRKSTRLNSSHDQISYAVFCLKKKKKKNNTTYIQKKLQKHTTPKHHKSCKRMRTTYNKTSPVYDKLLMYDYDLSSTLNCDIPP